MAATLKFVFTKVKPTFSCAQKLAQTGCFCEAD